MHAELCKLVDDYLSGELPPSDVARFEEHLPHCAACEETIRGQRRIDRLLQQATRSTPLPQMLAQRCQARTAQLQRRRSLAIAGFAAAASIALLLALDRYVARTAGLPTVASDGRPELDPTTTDERATVRVQIDPKSGLLAMPQATQRANVTIIWLYPTVEAPARLEDSRGEQNIERSEL